MNGATLDSTFNVFFKLKIAKTYDAVLSTPLGPGDIALGELTWALMRATVYSTAFLVVMAWLGYVLSPWAILCLPAAMCVSFAFAAVGMAGTTYMRSWQDFDKVSLALIPLFLFSATFYPLSVYPGWLQAVVRCTPLYQGVALLRGLDSGVLSWSLLAHAAYLAHRRMPRPGRGHTTHGHVAAPLQQCRRSHARSGGRRCSPAREVRSEGPCRANIRVDSTDIRRSCPRAPCLTTIPSTRNGSAPPACA